MPHIIRIFVLTLLAISSLVVSARTVTSDRAVQIAAEFFGGQTHANAPLKIKSLSHGVGTPASQPYYIFNAPTQGNGFVIISGDDRIQRILGYSDTGVFDPDNVPPQLADLLEQYATQIGSINSSSTHSSWAAPARSAGEGGILLETANWGQGEPYNALSPKFDGQHAPTGCVATAMAIVMKYHNWPDTYNWSDMPVNIVSDGQQPEIARLMKDAGESVFMDYGSIESGANMNWVGHKLQYDFKYSPDCQFITSQNFGNEEWVSMLRDNLEKGDPVIYNGTGTGNHAFIIDGIKGDLYHVNWGWDGRFNGYFALSALQPGEGSDFSYNSAMVINITPDKSGKIYSNAFTDYGYFWALQGFQEFMNVNVSNIEQGVPFDFMHGSITFPAGFKGDVGLGIIDDEDNIRQVLAYTPRSTWSDLENKYVLTGYDLGFSDVTPSIDVKPTDRLQLITKHDGEDDWKLVLGTIEGPSFIPVTEIVPRTVKCSYDLDEGLYITFFYHVDKALENPAGKGEIDLLRGSKFEIAVNKLNPEDNGLLELRAEACGALDSLVNVIDENEIRYAWNLTSDISIQVRNLQLVDKEIVMLAGSISSLISETEARTISELKIIGTLDASDIWYIRDKFVNLKSLDISATTILEYTLPESTPGYKDVQIADYLPQYAFWQMKQLKKICLPSGLKGICEYGIAYLPVEDIDIPEGVEYIAPNSFYGCEKLESVIMRTMSPCNIDTSTFEQTLCPLQGVLFVPEKCKQTYANTVVWQEFEQIVETNNPEKFLETQDIDNINYKMKGERAMIVDGKNAVGDLVVPAYIDIDGHQCPVVEIKDNAFAYGIITSIIMPNTIKHIGASCFIGCYDLKSVTLSNTLTSIPAYAFCECRSLEEIINLDKITYIEQDVFSGTGFKKFYIHKNFTPTTGLISPFGNMRELECYEVEEGNPYYSVKDNVLYRTPEYRLESVPGKLNMPLTIWDEATEIGSYAISNVENLESLVIPDNIRSISYNGIYDNPNLIHIVLPVNVSADWFAIQNVFSCESLTIRDQKTPLKNLFSGNWVKNIYFDSSSTAKFNIAEIANGFDVIPNVYCNSVNPSLINLDESSTFVPGQAKCDITGSIVSEMWKYSLNRENGKLQIKPLIEDILIDQVLVNGIKIAPDAENIYHYNNTLARSASYDPDVLVDYTLHGFQHMTTHYTPEFNATLPDEELGALSSMGRVDSDNMISLNVSGSTLYISGANENSCAFIYDIIGNVVYHGTQRKICDLTPGVYIVTIENHSFKIAIK